MPLSTPPPANSNRSHAVQELMDRFIPEMPPWTWMSTELVHALEGGFEATRAHMLMALVRSGQITPEQAQEITPQQLFIAAFDLGLKCGEELERLNAFKDMMGEERY